MNKPQATEYSELTWVANLPLAGDPVFLRQMSGGERLLCFKELFKFRQLIGSLDHSENTTTVIV